MEKIKTYFDSLFKERKIRGKLIEDYLNNYDKFKLMSNQDQQQQILPTYSSDHDDDDTRIIFPQTHQKNIYER